MEHWQAYAQRYGAPVTRLPIANPLHLRDQAGRKRASLCFATSSACAKGILSSECVPFAALVTHNASLKADYFAQPVPECLQCLDELTRTLFKAYDTRLTPHLQALITASASPLSKMVPAVHQVNSGYVIWHCQGKGTVTVPQYRMDQHQAHVICPNGDVAISVFFESLLILPSKKGPVVVPTHTGSLRLVPWQIAADNRDASAHTQGQTLATEARLPQAGSIPHMGDDPSPAGSCPNELNPSTPMLVDYPQNASKHCPWETAQYQTEKPADCAPTLPFTVHLQADGGRQSVEPGVGPTPPGDLDQDMEVALIPGQPNENAPLDSCGNNLELSPSPLFPHDDLTQRPPDETVESGGQGIRCSRTKDQQPDQHLMHADDGANLQDSKPALAEGLEDMEIDDPSSMIAHRPDNCALPPETISRAYSQQDAQLQEPIPVEHGHSPPLHYIDTNLDDNKPHLTGNLLGITASGSQIQETELADQSTALRKEEGTNKRKDEEPSTIVPADCDKPPLAAPPPREGGFGARPA